MTTTTQPMTAADHFLRGEELLNHASLFRDADLAQSCTAQARVHFEAARLLLDVATMCYGAERAVRDTGMTQIVVNRTAD